MDSRPVPTAVLAEILTLGDESAGDSVLFGAIDNVIVDGRGRILVQEQRPPAIRAFSRDGTYLGPVGAEGEAPGEYRYIRGVAIGPADSVFVMAGIRDYVFVYEPASFAIARSISLPGGVLFASTAEGLLVWHRPDHVEEADWGFVGMEHPSSLHLYGPGGHVLASDLVRTRLSAMLVYKDAKTGGFSFFGNPFTPSGYAALGPLGRVYFGWSDSVRIHLNSLESDDLRTIRHAIDLVPVEAEEIDAHLDNSPDFFRGLHEDYGTRHTHKPAYNALVVDDESRLWLKLSHAASADSVDWLVLDDHGNSVARATLPRRVTIRAVQDGHAYATLQDDAGPRVVVYAVTLP